MGNHISTNLAGKYSKNVFDNAKNSGADAIKIVSKRIIQKRGEATADLMGNNNADKVTEIV